MWKAALTVLIPEGRVEMLMPVTPIQKKNVPNVISGTLCGAPTFEVP
jgi:hypothetical protein